MSVIDTAKILGELAKKGVTVEFQEKIMQLREEALELQGENLKLKTETLKLKEQIELQETVTFRRKVYWRDGDEVPFCPYCYEASGQLMHLAHGGGGSEHRCPECLTIYNEQGEGDFRMNTQRGGERRGAKMKR